MSSNSSSDHSTNQKIYDSLLQRDQKEKHVQLEKVLEANEKLVHLVHTLKTEIDNLNGKLDIANNKNKIFQRSIEELKCIVKEKDTMVHRLILKQ